LNALVKFVRRQTGGIYHTPYLPHLKNAVQNSYTDLSANVALKLNQIGPSELKQIKWDFKTIYDVDISGINKSKK